MWVLHFDQVSNLICRDQMGVSYLHVQVVRQTHMSLRILVAELQLDPTCVTITIVCPPSLPAGVAFLTFLTQRDFHVPTNNTLPSCLSSLLFVMRPNDIYHVSGAKLVGSCVSSQTPVSNS